MFFDKIELKFNSKQSNTEEGNDKDEILFLKIPYLGNDSRNFFKSVFTILKRKFDIKIVPVYYTFKVGRYFQLKSPTPTALCANVRCLSIHLFV